MTYRGTVKNGVVQLEPGTQLRDGETVEVRPITERADQGPTLFDRLKDVIGTCSNLPADMAENHDHYIHGSRKRGENE